MAVVDALSPGSFCWPELAAGEPTTAIAFYADLFGWTVHESNSDAGPYYLFRIGERVAAAMFVISPEMRETGVRPHWGAYVSVESADATVAKAKAAGGTLVMGPFDVLEAGRMAVLRDPLGATFVAWQARKTAGIGVANEPGALGWTQLNARDGEVAKAFYTAVLGWTAEDAPMGGGVTYTTWQKSDGPAGGMMVMPPDVPAEAPSHWLSYFCVADIHAGHEKAVALGAMSFVAPTEIPGGGAFAVLADPQGALFGLMTAM
jgi:predicted enzyme related to lactoylglutathione lyase